METIQCRKKFYYKIIFLLFSMIFFLNIRNNAQDITGGEMLLTCLGGYSYQVDIFLYTKTSIGIDHSTICVQSDSSGFDILTAVSNILPYDFTEWHYSFTHTYPGPGNYQIIATDSFRIAGIDNIHNSNKEKIILKKNIIINPFLGRNSNPQLSNKQTDIGISDGYFIHNPNAVDPDNDSLSFSLVQTSTSNYFFPSDAYINPLTGELSVPFSDSLFAVAIQIDEWRSGIKIGSTIREMIIDSSMVNSSYSYPSYSNIKNFPYILIYPNPNNGNMQVLYKIPENTKGKFEVYDQMGEKLFSYILNSGTNTLIISKSNLNPGIYYYHATAGNKVIAKDKIVVIK